VKMKKSPDVDDGFRASNRSCFVFDRSIVRKTPKNLERRSGRRAGWLARTREGALVGRSQRLGLRLDRLLRAVPLEERRQKLRGSLRVGRFLELPDGLDGLVHLRPRQPASLLVGRVVPIEGIDGGVRGRGSVLLLLLLDAERVVLDRSDAGSLDVPELPLRVPEGAVRGGSEPSTLLGSGAEADPVDLILLLDAVQCFGREPNDASAAAGCSGSVPLLVVFDRRGAMRPLLLLLLLLPAPIVPSMKGLGDARRGDVRRLRESAYDLGAVAADERQIGVQSISIVQHDGDDGMRCGFVLSFSEKSGWCLFVCLCREEMKTMVVRFAR